MNRLTRLAAASLLTVTTLVATAPAAQALPLGKPQPARVVDGSWFDAALIWLSQFLGAPQKPTVQNVREKASAAPTDMNSANTTSGGFTGSCIDPNGCIVVERGGGKP